MTAPTPADVFAHSQDGDGGHHDNGAPRWRLTPRDQFFANERNRRTALNAAVEWLGAEAEQSTVPGVIAVARVFLAFLDEVPS